MHQPHMGLETMDAATQHLLLVSWKGLQTIDGLQSLQSLHQLPPDGGGVMYAWALEIHIGPAKHHSSLLPDLAKSHMHILILHLTANTASKLKCILAVGRYSWHARTMI